jgi:hypothetical protein
LKSNALPGRTVFAQLQALARAERPARKQEICFGTLSAPPTAAIFNRGFLNAPSFLNLQRRTLRLRPDQPHMTDLQASLIGIGGVIVAGVISYNKWQEYKARKSMERAFSSSHDDVLMRSGNPAEGIERHEPGFGPQGDEPGTAPARELGVDSLIDCVVPLMLEGPLRGEKILPVLMSLRHVGSKPVHFIGEAASGEWENTGHGGVYVALQAGIQLANRSGPLNELEYSEFVARLRQVADELGAEPDVPDMTAVMAGAVELHQFVSEHDAQLGVNVQSNGAPWEISTLLTALERQGFDLRPDGRLVMPDGDGGILFSLQTNVTLAAETTSRLTLLLNVPCVAPRRDAFGAMVACAKSLADKLGGTVVDDASQPLSDEALGQIAAQVDSFCDDMEQAGIAPGSARAMRLFS